MVLVSSVTRLISCCACPTPCTTLYYPSPSNQPSPTLPLIVSPPSPPPLFRPPFLDIFPFAPPFSMTNIQYWASRDILGNYVMSASDVVFCCPQTCIIHSLLQGWLGLPHHRLVSTPLGIYSDRPHYGGRSQGSGPYDAPGPISPASI